MSRKSNNLRKRLRIEAERIPKREAELRHIAGNLEEGRRQLEAEKQKAVALTIRLDQPTRQFGDLLQITTCFYPAMFAYGIARGPNYEGPDRFSNMRNASRAADQIAHELAIKVRGAILEFIQTGQVTT